MLKIKNGFSLIELMIAMTIGLLLLAGLSTILIENFKTSKTQRNQIYLQQQMRMIMDYMVSDLKRAGYWGGAYTQVATSPAPTANINPFKTIDASTTTCLTYSYDSNADGVLQPSEVFGFKVDAGTLLARTSAAENGSGCETSIGWQALSDLNKVSIGLTFIVTSQNCKQSTGDATCVGATTVGYVPVPSAQTPISASMQNRTIEISLIGQMTSEPSIQGQLTETVRVRNDQLQP